MRCMILEISFARDLANLLGSDEKSKYKAPSTKNVIEMGRISLAASVLLAVALALLAPPSRSKVQNHAHALDSGGWSFCLPLTSGVSGAGSLAFDRRGRG